MDERPRHLDQPLVKISPGPGPGSAARSPPGRRGLVINLGVEAAEEADVMAAEIARLLELARRASTLGDLWVAMPPLLHHGMARRKASSSSAPKSARISSPPAHGRGLGLAGKTLEFREGGRIVLDVDLPVGDAVLPQIVPPPRRTRGSRFDVEEGTGRGHAGSLRGGPVLSPTKFASGPLPSRCVPL